MNEQFASAHGAFITQAEVARSGDGVASRDRLQEGWNALGKIYWEAGSDQRTAMQGQMEQACEVAAELGLAKPRFPARQHG